jgi:hypothetical protein
MAVFSCVYATVGARQCRARVHPDFANVFSGVQVKSALQACLNCVLANLGCTRRALTESCIARNSNPL